MNNLSESWDIFVAFWGMIYMMIVETFGGFLRLFT